MARSMPVSERPHIIVQLFKAPMQRRRFRQSFIVLLLTGAATFSAGAQTLQLRGRTLQMAGVTGFCELGETAPEQKLLEFQTRNTKVAGQLVQFLVPCDELASVLAGKAGWFTRWVQALVLTPNGTEPVFDLPRATYVQSIRSAFSKTPDMIDRVNQQARDGLEKYRGDGPDVKSVASSMNLLEDDPNAVLLSLTGRASVNSSAGDFGAVMAGTLIDKLPVSLYAMGSPAMLESGELLAIAKAYLAAVLEAN